MSKYKMVSIRDCNDYTVLEATGFQEAVEEALNCCGWYIITDGDYHIGVNNADPNHTIELTEIYFEDAQYEALEQLGYYITTATNED